MIRASRNIHISNMVHAHSNDFGPKWFKLDVQTLIRQFMVLEMIWYIKLLENKFHGF